MTASIARDEQSRHSTHFQGTGVQTGIMTLMTGIEIGLHATFPYHNIRHAVVVPFRIVVETILWKGIFYRLV